LADPSDFVRTAAAEILAKSDDPKALDRLVALAKSDPSVRVRETALGGLAEKTGPAALGAVKAAIASDDPVIVSSAAQVAGVNGWTELAPDLRAAYARHPGTKGADAREGIIDALQKFGLGDDAGLISRATSDPDAPVRAIAQASFAQRAGVEPPPVDRRPRPEGA